MPPRTSPGQLDQISEAIGELKGCVKSIETYVHEGRHGVNNLAQKVDAIGTRITRDIAAVEARIEARMQLMDDRVIALEKARDQQTGAKNLAVWFLQSPLVGWVVAGATLWIAWWRKP